MEVLVTGGMGYIGSHTVVELVEANYEVIIVDSLINSSTDVIKRIKEITNKEIIFYNVDLLNKEYLSHVFSQHSIEAVIHFAGHKLAEESVSLPLKYYKNNLISTINLCEVMEENSVYNFIFGSSASVYGTPEKLPLDESCTTEALDPYGKTKLMSEEILLDLSRSNPKWKIALLRFFNPVGVHEGGLIGENPNGIPNNLLTYINKVATGELKKLKVFGGDYPTDDGTGVRDYIHVVDLAKSHLKVLEKINHLDQVEIFNLGRGCGYSVLQVIKTFEKITGVKIPFEIVDRRPGDVAICYADPEKSNKILGWKAKKDLDEICRDTFEWQLNIHKEKLTNKI